MQLKTSNRNEIVVYCFAKNFLRHRGISSCKERLKWVPLGGLCTSFATTDTVTIFFADFSNTLPDAVTRLKAMRIWIINSEKVCGPLEPLQKNLILSSWHVHSLNSFNNIASADCLVVQPPVTEWSTRPCEKSPSLFRGSSYCSMTPAELKPHWQNLKSSYGSCYILLECCVSLSWRHRTDGKR